MNDDSDESEYVDDNGSGSDTRKTRKDPAKAKTPLKKKAGTKSRNFREPSAIPDELAETSLPAGHSTTAKSVLRSYRDHLNSTILEIAGNDKRHANDAHLEPSQIGASFWTIQEKHNFFAALQSHGTGDLLQLATAVGTKSVPEIKAYILLLQRGAKEVRAKSRHDFGPADLPAAGEIGAECLEAEEAAAGVLEAKARAVEEGNEKVRWGKEHWLIDEDVAAALDAKYEDAVEHEDSAENNDIVADDANLDHTARTSDESDNSPPTSLELLKASSLLQLSRTVFMNSKDPSSNWRTLAETDPSGLRPSIRRTAFDDFHNLVVSLTRRLMQVSIFQALSRLRASSDPRVQPNVHVFDVVAARETIGLHPGGSEYWGQAVKRCGVEVYVDAKKYRAEDGRKGTKIGYRLSESELGTELGIKPTESSENTNGFSDTIKDNDDNDLEELDSDAYTDTGASDQSLNDDDAENGLLENEEEANINTRRHRRTDSKGRPLSERKRPLSPASFGRAESRYLEDLDRIQSTAEENDLRAILELDLLPEKKSQKPAFPFKQAEAETRSSDWRDVVQFEAPWEQAGGMPKKRDFGLMELEGVRRRKRRRLMSGATADEAESDELVESERAEESGEGEEEEEEVNVSDPGSEESQSSVGSAEEEQQEEEEEE